MTNEVDYQSLLTIKNVSRETFLHLKRYEELLHKWQKAFNLVWTNTLSDSWNRHFIDSIQISPMISPKFTVLDIGSGAGFPGMVLSICGHDITMVESDANKIQFLKNVSRETFSTNSIIHSRIENLEPKKFDVIVSRALSNLNQLLLWSYPFLDTGSYCLFHKGQNWKNEIEEAKHNNWDFIWESTPSVTSSSSCILKITSITKRG